ASQVARSEAKGHGKWGRLSLVSFFGESKKETAPPGAHPGLQRHQRHYAFNSCLRPPRLVKTLISFKKPRAGRNCGQARARAKGAPQDKPAGD
ncbi:MAG TPA: hypothetical protein P5093_15215, partial [Ottowia sp.]|uniref:hypothetical protein n=2 Tax=Ottowia sp. TaxID=1898956 RepID=UPI002CA709C0